LATVVATDFWRYGVPAMEARREAQRQASGNSFPDAAAPTPLSNAPAGSSQAGSDASDALVHKHNCQACHGQDLRGQQLGALYAPNLTSSGVAGSWSEAEFIAAMRTGQRPDGNQMSDAMPWRAIGKADDEALKRLWAYLKSLP
jgi:cytochrome c553